MKCINYIMKCSNYIALVFCFYGCASMPERRSELIQCEIPNLYVLPREIRKQIVNDAIYGCENQIENVNDFHIDKEALVDCMLNKDWLVTVHINRQKRALLRKAILRTEMNYVDPMQKEAELDRLTNYHESMQVTPEEQRQVLPVNASEGDFDMSKLAPETRQLFKQVAHDAAQTELEQEALDRESQTEALKRGKSK